MTRYSCGVERRFVLVAVAFVGCRPSLAPTSNVAPEPAPVHTAREEVPPSTSEDDQAQAPSPSADRPLVRIQDGDVLSLDHEQTLVWEHLTIKRLLPNPNDPNDGGGDEGVLSLSVAGMNCSFRAGQPDSAVDVCWADSFRVELVALHGPPKNAADIRVESAVEPKDAKATRTQRIDRGQEIKIGDDTLLRFVGHSHKRTSPGQTSPLIVEVEYMVGDQPPELDFVSLHPPDDRSWRWHEFGFESVAHEYGQWMELKVTTLDLIPGVVE